MKTVDRRVLEIDISNGRVESIEQEYFVEWKDKEGEKAA